MTEGAPEPSKALLPVLVLVATVTAAVGSLGTPLLATIARVDHVTLGNSQWSLTLPVLVGAVGTPVLGRLGDGPARKRVLLGSLAVIAVGSVLAALPGGGFPVLLTGRAMQGVGFGLAPLVMAVARGHLPELRLGRAVAILSVSATAGVGLGYPLTGVLDEAFGLHATFLFGALVSGVAFALCWRVLPASTELRRNPIDMSGAALLGVALLGLLLALTEGRSWGWVSAPVVGLVVGAMALAGLWVRHELAAENPLVELRLLRHRAVSITDVGGFLISLSMYLFIPVLADFVQTPKSAGYGFGFSVAIAGLMLLPFSLLSVLVSPLAARMVNRIGHQTVVSIGALLTAAGCAVVAATATSPWETFVGMGITGMGIGFCFAAMPGLIIRAVPREETGSAMGFFQVVRTVGFSVGSGLSSTILAAYTPAGHLLPQRWGFILAMYLGAGFSVIAAVVSLLRGPAAPAQASMTLGMTAVDTTPAARADAVSD